MRDFGLTVFALSVFDYTEVQEQMADPPVILCPSPDLSISWSPFVQERFVLIGAGSAMFTRGLLFDLIRRNIEAEVALVDTDPNALETIERLAAKMISARKAPLKLSAAVDRRDAFPGATAVICTIGVGGRRAWEQDVFSFENTVAGGDRVFAQMREDALSPVPLDETYFRAFGGEHEQVIDIIDSIRTGAGRQYACNVPNRGVVENLPAEAVIEVTCHATAQGIVPVPQGRIPEAWAAPLVSRLASVELIVDAALIGSRDRFVQALVVDGSVPDLDTAEALADELLDAQRECLPKRIWEKEARTQLCR